MPKFILTFLFLLSILTSISQSYLGWATKKVNIQKYCQKANASVFLFFPTSHFLKTILASRTNGTFGFAQHTSRPFAKPKEPFFANAPKTINWIILN